ncbi:MAG: PQQ-binding-like beta-propeller repeat protein [Thermoguttaceae bacterium]|jgi:outer membrane protein assembly factor BamB
MTKSVLACLLAWTACASLGAQEWPRFRGPNGSGECEADGIPVTWGENDYLWKVQLPGAGKSSPVAWDNRVYVTSSDEADAAQLVSCLDVADGSDVWQRRFPGKVYKKNALNSFAAATPALDRDHIYLAWTAPEQYTIVALDQQTGKDAWRRNLGPFAAQHGFGASPIVFKDMLIVPNDQDGASSLIALDCRTGKTRWTSPRRNTIAAYSTPFVYSGQNGSPELILASNAHGISSFDPHTGKLNWELPVMKHRVVGSPILAGGLIFAACGEGAGGKQMFAVQPPDAGKNHAAKVAYNVDAKLPYVVTPVACGTLIFLWTDQGIVSCLNAVTGKTLWQQRVDGKYYGSPIRIRDRLYCISREGQVVVIAAADKYKLLGQTKLNEPSQSTPAVSGGVLLLRTESQLLAVGKKQVH